MKSKIIFPTILIIFSLVFVFNIALADNADNHKNEIEQVRELVESKVSCDKLSDEQLEAIGEYLMEQMHPGEAHEMMDKMMGGEGSESLEQAHIQMAKRLYCNEGVDGMMGGGDNSMPAPLRSFTGMGNMMSNSSWGMGAGWAGFGWISMILFWVLMGLAIAALIKYIKK